MPETYIDRGIIKWNPFDALAGYGSMLDEMRHRRGRQEKPILSDDTYAQMNVTFNDAFLQKKTIEIGYFKNGYVLNTYGTIVSIDWVRRIITISTTEKIPADDIVSFVAEE